MCWSAGDWRARSWEPQHRMPPRQDPAAARISASATAKIGGAVRLPPLEEAACRLVFFSGRTCGHEVMLTRPTDTPILVVRAFWRSTPVAASPPQRFLLG